MRLFVLFLSLVLALGEGEKMVSDTWLQSTNEKKDIKLLYKTDGEEKDYSLRGAGPQPAFRHGLKIHKFKQKVDCGNGSG